MAATLEELEQRLSKVEQMITLWHPHGDESPAERGARMLRNAELQQPYIAAAWAKMMEEMGISGEPVSIEELHEMMIADGVNPEDNEFSRGIIEMREE